MILQWENYYKTALLATLWIEQIRKNNLILNGIWNINFMPGWKNSYLNLWDIDNVFLYNRPFLLKYVSCDGREIEVDFK